MLITYKIFIPLSFAIHGETMESRRNKRRARDRIRRDDTFSFVARFPHVDIRGCPSRIKNWPSVCSHEYGKREGGGKRRKTRRNHGAESRDASRIPRRSRKWRTAGQRATERSGKIDAYTRRCRWFHGSPPQIALMRIDVIAASRARWQTRKICFSSCGRNVIENILPRACCINLHPPDSASE